MGYLTKKISSVVDLVSKIEELSGVTVVKEFPAVIKDNPLNGIVVSYGIESIDATYENPEYQGQLYLEIKFIFTIHAPLTYSGEDCQNVYMQIIEHLNDDMPLFIKYGCGNARFERSTSTLVFEGWGITRETIMQNV